LFADYLGCLFVAPQTKIKEDIGKRLHQAGIFAGLKADGVMPPKRLVDVTTSAP
jgi:hypothetical protein